MNSAIANLRASYEQEREAVRAFCEQLSKGELNPSDDELDAGLEPFRVLQGEIYSMPPRTAEDLALKARALNDEVRSNIEDEGSEDDVFEHGLLRLTADVCAFFGEQGYYDVPPREELLQQYQVRRQQFERVIAERDAAEMSSPHYRDGRLLEIDKECAAAWKVSDDFHDSSTYRDAEAAYLRMRPPVNLKTYEVDPILKKAAHEESGFAAVEEEGEGSKGTCFSA